MLHRFISLFSATLLLPLQTPSTWDLPVFTRLKPSTVHYLPNGLEIQVRHSSSPIVHFFKSTMTVRKVEVEGELTGLPNLGNAKEGIGKGDDFPLRVGLVLEGERELSWWQRTFAPRWLQELSKKSPSHKVGGVIFLTLAQTLPRGWHRKHPRSEQLEEWVVHTQTQPGAFRFSQACDPPRRVIGVWLQSDGDDTGSDYEVRLRRIALETD